MATTPNKALRVIVPIIAFLIMIPVIWAVGSQSSKQANKATSSGTPVPGSATSGTTSNAEAAGGNERPAEATSDGQPKPSEPALAEQTAERGPVTQPGEQGQEVGGVPGAKRALSLERFADVTEFDPLVAGGALSITFSPVGAGVRSIELLPYAAKVGGEARVRVQFERYVVVDQAGDPGMERRYRPTLAPFSASTLTLDGVVLALTDVPPIDVPAGAPASTYTDFTPAPVWRQVKPGMFEAFVVEGAGEGVPGRRVARIVREFTTTPDSFVISLDQRVENLTNAPMNASLTFFGPGEFAEPTGVESRLDPRKVRFGYMLSSKSGDPARDTTVFSNDYQWPRTSGQVKGTPQNKLLPQVHRIWANTQSEKEDDRLAWVGVSDRYFGVAVFPAQLGADSGGKPLPVPMAGIQQVDRVLLVQQGDVKNADIALRLTTVTRVAPAASAGAPGVARFATDIYAGPLSEEKVTQDDGARIMGVEGLILYNMGGMCAFCTFSWLAHGLKGLLTFLHNALVHDWALAIVLLVVVVRSCLHPVTRWSQIKMQRFGKQMQAMAPKQKAIQEKYAGDRAKMQQEMAKLWREEGINPAGMLGCIPLLLQSPVWIALYAMLYFDFDLRHEAAFYGLFQTIAKGWPFLADLSAPDAAIPFGMTFDIPLVTMLTGPIGSVNILPLILGVVFFLQQKYLTPPTSTAQSPEQEMQMKMVKWMSVFMFPVFMYNAPAGLTLYFITNSTLGIFEVKYIRAHYKKLEEAGKFDRKPGKPRREPKPGGFLDRLRQAAEAQKAAAEAANKQQAKMERQARPGNKDGGERKYKKR